MASAQYFAHNANDVGGVSADQHPISTSILDAAEAPLAEMIEKSQKPYLHWEFSCHALYLLLLSKGHAKAGEIRRAIEQLPFDAFQTKTYYEKWAMALARVTIERGVITQAELDAAMGDTHATPEVLFKGGDYVRVKPEDSSCRYRKPHLRTPGYLFGVIGRIQENAPIIYLEEPDTSSWADAQGPKQPVYRVTFFQRDIWEGYPDSTTDTVSIEIWQPWLEKSSAADFEAQQASRAKLDSTGGKQGTKRPHEHSHRGEAGHSHAHDHHHHHHGDDEGEDHVHEERTVVEANAVEKEGDAADRSAFFNALLKVFLEKGIVTPAEMRERVETLESYGADPIGPRLVAKAWVDPAFKARLLEDGMSAAFELEGFTAPGYPLKGGFKEETKEVTGNLLVVVEDTETVYNLIVCTLCSCYPVHILGLSPSWYKSRAYRARSVRNPRAVLKEFGTELPASVSVVVHDSTADTRFMKIPLRPAGTDGWSEERLRGLINRDCLVGVSQPRSPTTEAGAT